jgi:hypothetical protein
MKGLLVIAIALWPLYTHAQNRVWSGITFEKSESSSGQKHTPSVGGFPNVIQAELPVYTSVVQAKGYGLGISCEWFITAKEMVSIVIPVYLSRPVQLGYHGTGDQWQVLSTQFCAPGMRFHPLGNGRDVDISIGLQCAVGSYLIKDMMVTSFGRREMSQISSSLVALEANINLYPTDHNVVGFRIANGRLQSATELIQVGFKFGGRF